MKFIRTMAMLLMVVGSLNWGLIGFFQYDLISDLFGGMMTTGARIIFAIVGIAGLYGLKLFCCCLGCGCKCGSNCNCNKK